MKKNTEKKRLSKTELQFMELIWQNPKGISSEEIYEQFPQARGTKSTILFNIVKKGYAEGKQQGRHHIYHPLINKEDYYSLYEQIDLSESLSRLSLEELVVAFSGNKQLTPSQKQKVQELLQALEND